MWSCLCVPPLVVQIILDSLLTFYEVSRSACSPAAASSSSSSSGEDASGPDSSAAAAAATMSEHFYPTVVAESVYGSFDVAIDHLNRKLIATRNPEQIRGGGLLKYCNLVVRNFRQVRSLRSHLISDTLADRQTDRQTDSSQYVDSCIVH